MVNVSVQALGTPVDVRVRRASLRR
jgi:hypothetical protein